MLAEDEDEDTDEEDGSNNSPMPPQKSIVAVKAAKLSHKKPVVVEVQQDAHTVQVADTKNTGVSKEAIAMDIVAALAFAF